MKSLENTVTTVAVVALCTILSGCAPSPDGKVPPSEYPQPSPSETVFTDGVMPQSEDNFQVYDFANGENTLTVENTLITCDLNGGMFPESVSVGIRADGTVIQGGCVWPLSEADEAEMRKLYPGN